MRHILLNCLIASFLVPGTGQPGGQFIKVFLPDGYTLTAELAVTDEERAQGLMFREELPEDLGMLFLFEEEGQRAFWMKNMRFSIDILWLDEAKRIVHIERSVPPCPREPCPSYVSALPAKYVLELKSGSTGAHGLQLYDRLDFILPHEKDI